MKDLIELLKTRRSVRDYDKKDIPQGVLEEIIDVARFAPTARNEQPWIFILIRDKEKITDLAQIVSPNGAFLKETNACVCVFCKDTKYYLEDGSSAIVYILLAAWEKGIGSCWIAGDKKPYCDTIKDKLKAPADYKLIGLISLGYPSGVSQKSKKKLDQVLYYEDFG